MHLSQGGRVNAFVLISAYFARELVLNDCFSRYSQSELSNALSLSLTHTHTSTRFTHTHSHSKQRC